MPNRIELMRNGELPPPGRPLDFAEFARLIDTELRAELAVVATRIGTRLVRWRYAGRTATLTHDRNTYWFRFIADDGSRMASLFAEERRDAFTARNFARSVAGYFDARLSVKRES